MQVTHKGALSGNQPQAFALVGSGMRLKTIIQGNLRYDRAVGTSVIRGVVGLYRESDGQMLAMVTTDSLGAYKFTNIDGGNYQLIAASSVTASGVN